MDDVRPIPGWQMACLPGDEPEADDDPQCVCGVYLSEHRMLGCPEGFQAAAAWKEERDAIYACAEGYDGDLHYDAEDY